MLAIISDLHLQHTHDDFVRYRDADGNVRQSGVRRNVKAAAIQRFFAMLDERARRHASKQVHLVFAGDIFELQRSPLWFMGQDNEVRPYPTAWDDQDDASMVARRRAKVDAILDRIEAEHDEVWHELAEQVAKQRATRRMEVHYLPGNHDRLCNAWRPVRARIRRLLAMEPASGHLFPNRIDFTGSDEDSYGVRVRHGHEYDPISFAYSTKTRTALDKAWYEYLEPAFSDFVTIDFAMRLAVAFRAYHACDMRRSTARGADLRRMYNDLTEFDDVRPPSLVVDYLVKRLGARQRRAFEYLQPALRDTVGLAARHPFFRKGARRFVPAALLELLPQLLKEVEPGVIDVLLRLISSEKRRLEPAPRAQLEIRKGGPVEIVVAGHTHHPEHVPLKPPRADTQAFYLDAGTWRTRIPVGIDAFGRVRAFTMVFCYSHAERQRGGDERQFETWTGHLAAGPLGPYDEPVQTACDAPCHLMEMHLDRIEVHSIQRELRGAELQLYLGVDGEGRMGRWSTVRPGGTLQLQIAPIPLDPALDGELWFHGAEKDFIRDDMLPWGLRRLPRDDNGQFKPGPVSMNIRGIGSAHLSLHGHIRRRASQEG
jgi:UDP-2,3-diacylglucosamine pyrophosphatase LpxH